MEKAIEHGGNGRTLTNGKRAPQACREAEITLHTYCGLKLDRTKRLKELEKENGRLKRLVAELSLEKQVLREVAQGNFQAPSGGVVR